MINRDSYVLTRQNVGLTSCNTSNEVKEAKSVISGNAGLLPPIVINLVFLQNRFQTNEIEDFLNDAMSLDPQIITIIQSKTRLDFLQIDSLKTNSTIPSWLTINEKQKSVCIEGSEVQFAPKEYLALVYLLRKSQALCSKDELIENVWPEAKNRDGVSDSAVDQLIRRIRKKIEHNPNHPVRLINKKGYGYILI
jgi:DNA-binding winged helix-turn-helix (wHTH) protein